MLIDFRYLKLKYSMEITGVVHAGAHLGQEAKFYKKLGTDHVLWIEANPNLIPDLCSKVKPMGHKVVNACVGAVTGDVVTFHFADSADKTNQGQSSSVLNLGTHKQASPEVDYVDETEMVIQTIDDIMEKYWYTNAAPPNFFNLDLQGYELEALKGSTKTLENMEYIYTEINVDSLYEDCVLLPELDDFLVTNGFEVKEVLLAGWTRRDGSEGGSPKWTGWGDMVAIRKSNPRPFSETHCAEFNDWCR